MRPSLEELAQRRAEAIRFLARNPDDVNAPMLRVLLAATAPPTKEEVLPVLIANANKAGGWPDKPTDRENAEFAVNGSASDMTHSWVRSVWSQWQTLVHFCGGAE